MDSDSHLILHRTSKEQIKEGVTVITRGQGVRVWDQDGKSYLDLVSGVTRPVHVGYGRKEIAQAVYDQICELSYFTPMQFANVPAMKLANVLSEIAPGKLADLIVIDQDILTIPENDIKDINVEMAVIDGKIVYQRE